MSGCEAKHYCKSYCRKHYKRWKRTGSAEDCGREPSQIAEVKDYLLVEIRGHKRGGDWFKVDKADRPLVEGRSFSKDTGGYARRWAGGEKKISLFHRELMGDPEDMEVDHINGDRLDNRRTNLRIVTRAQQMQNKKPWAASGHRNVHKRKDGSWRVVCKLDGKVHYGGTFKTIPEAAEAARTLRHKLFSHANEDRVALEEPSSPGA